MLLRSIGIGRGMSLLCLLGLVFMSGTSARATVYYVSPGGNDANTGTTWATAKATVNAAAGLAMTNDQIWVAAGTYVLTSTINLNANVALYGGFNGTEFSLSQRDYVHNVTTLDGNKSVTIVNLPSNTSIRTRVDGFSFQNASQYDIIGSGAVNIANNTFNEAGNGIDCIYLNIGGQSATIVNNLVNGSTATGITAASGGFHVSGNTVRNCSVCGINVSGLPNRAVVVNNNIATGCGTGFTIVADPLIVTQNSAIDNVGTGMVVDDNGPATANAPVSNNVIASNGGGGLYCAGPLTIRDNLIADNATGGAGGGILYNAGPGSCTIENNTVVDNAAGAATYGGGIYLYSLSNYYTYTIANNLVAFNTSGIDTDGTTSTGLTLTTNDVYASDFNNYDGLQPGATDISLDPLFVDHIGQNYHLTTLSPCIDAGTDSFVSLGDTDLDGNARIYGAHVDIGGYEWTPSAYPDLAALAVSPSTLCSGQSASCLITLTSAALPTGAVVQLTSTNPTVIAVPATFTVSGGADAALFTLTANAVASPQTTVVSATYRGITKSVTVTVNPLIASVTLTPSVVIGGASVKGVLTLNCPAPSAFSVTLKSSVPSVTVPATVAVAAGATAATFTATTTAVAADKTVTLTAVSGVQTLNATLIVDPSATLKNLVIAPVTVTGSLVATGVVTLTAAAPAGGIVIPIANSAPLVASVPTTITVPAGKRSVAFVIATNTVSASTAVTLTAALGAVTKTAKLTVSPATIAALTLVPSTVQGGENSIGIVTLALPATSPVIVTLSGGTVATSDVTSLVIPTGSIQATFNISTVTVTAQTSVTIQASVYGVAKKATLTVTP